MLCPGFVRTRIWESGRNLQTGTPDGIGRFNHFHNIQSGGEGSIYWTPATGAHEVHGAVRDSWSGLGWERSWLGYPVSDDFQTADSTWQGSHFQNGTIVWSRIGWPTQVGAQPHRAGHPISLGKATPNWGLLANSGFEGLPMKSVYFFAGNWKFEVRRWYQVRLVSQRQHVRSILPTRAISGGRRSKRTGTLRWIDGCCRSQRC